MLFNWADCGCCPAVRKTKHADWSEYVGQVGRKTQADIAKIRGSSMAFEPGGANNTEVNMHIGNSADPIPEWAKCKLRSPEKGSRR